MISAQEDEFADFVDFGDIDFSAFQDIPPGDTDLQHNGAGAMDTSMDGNVGTFGLEQGHLQQHQTKPHHSQAPLMNGFHGSTDSFPDLAMQSETFEQQQQHQIHMQAQQYHGQNAVPPTPNSMEMHGAHSHYYRTPMDQAQLHMYDQYRRQKEQVGVFRMRITNVNFS